MISTTEKIRASNKIDPGLRHSFFARDTARLVDLTGVGHLWVEFDLAEGVLVAGHVLLQDSHQRFGLLGAEVDALKVAYLDLVFALLFQRAKHQKEIPDADTHLHAVGIIFPVRVSLDQLDIWLIRIGHGVVQCSGIMSD